MCALQLVIHYMAYVDCADLRGIEYPASTPGSEALEQYLSGGPLLTTSQFVTVTI